MECGGDWPAVRSVRGLAVGRCVVVFAVLAVVLWLAGSSAGCRGVESDRLDQAGAFFTPIGGVAMTAQGEPARTSGSEAGPLEGARLVGGRAAEEVARLPDSAIRLDVALAVRASEVKAEDVTVRVDNQHVLLEGRVRDRRARDRVELIARRAKGVRGVVNRLEVARPSVSPRAGATP